MVVWTRLKYKRHDARLGLAFGPMGPLNNVVLALDRRSLFTFSRTNRLFLHNTKACVPAMVITSKRMLKDDSNKKAFMENYVLKIVIDTRSMQPTIIRFCHRSSAPIATNQRYYSKSQTILRFFTFTDPAKQIRPLQFDSDGRLATNDQLIRCSLNGLSFFIIHPLSVFSG